MCERCPECPFSILYIPNIKAQKDSNSLLLSNHVHLTAPSLNTNKWPQRKALKSSAAVPCLRAYNHKAAKDRITNLRSLNRSLAKQRLGSALSCLTNLANAYPDIPPMSSFSSHIYGSSKNVTKEYSKCQEMLECARFPKVSGLSEEVKMSASLAAQRSLKACVATSQLPVKSADQFWQTNLFSGQS